MPTQSLKLSAPFQIGPRLLPALRVADAWLSLSAGPRNAEGRTVYTYLIDIDGKKPCIGSDLKSGCQGGTLTEGFCSLLCFLGFESEEDGLFPRRVSDWAKANDDELAMLRMEIEESPTPLIETA